MGISDGIALQGGGRGGGCTRSKPRGAVFYEYLNLRCLRDIFVASKTSKLIKLTQNKSKYTCIYANLFSLRLVILN